MRRARELALASFAALLVACGGGGENCQPGGASATCAEIRPPSASMTERAVAFTDAGATARGDRSVDGPAIDAVRTGSGLRITAYQGEQRTGGYAIRIERIAKAGSELRVIARFTAPAQDAMVTMALTSPAHTVTVDETADTVVLYDTTGAERARTSPR